MSFTRYNGLRGERPFRNPAPVTQGKPMSEQRVYRGYCCETHYHVATSGNRAQRRRYGIRCP